MIRKRLAVVEQILYNDNETAEIAVEVDGLKQKAINYNFITGNVSVGDRVVLNTNAVHLNLGTGGHHFVICNIDNHESDFGNSGGHTIKLRYTPLQVKCITAEEQESAYHDVLKDLDSINGMKVLIGPLHSMLAPAVQIIKSLNPTLRIAYIMTDSACLPMAYSNTVKELKKRRLIDATISSGQAFGGEFEAVNIYTALLTAKYVCKCDIALVIPGPGVVGTATKLGFSNVEEGHIIDAVNTLKGQPYLIPRISFSDKRERHYGISHHTLTVLSRICYTHAFIGLPKLDKPEQNVLHNQLSKYGIFKKHYVKFIKYNALAILDNGNVKLETMGRRLKDDECYYMAIGAAVYYCINDKI